MRWLTVIVALVLGGCPQPETTACIARCQSFAGEPSLCQTMCTRSCAELRQSFGVSEAACRRMQQGVDSPGVVESAAVVEPVEPVSAARRIVASRLARQTPRGGC